MYLAHVRHKVKDYAVWRKAFDCNAPMLEKAGVIGEPVFWGGEVARRHELTIDSGQSTIARLRPLFFATAPSSNG